MLRSAPQNSSISGSLSHVTPHVTMWRHTQNQADSRRLIVTYVTCMFDCWCSLSGEFQWISKGKMPARCVVAGCSNTTKDGVSLHLFPKDENTRRLWKTKVKLTRANWSGPSESSVICSAHFRDDDFVESLHSQFGIQKKRLLKIGAVPTIQLGVAGSSEEKGPRGAAVKRERKRVS